MPNYPPTLDHVPPLGPVTATTRYTLDYQVGTYLANRKVTRYWQRSGNLMIPVAAADGAPQEVVKQHAAAGGKVVMFTVTRLGLMPLVPGVEKSDPNVIYLGGEVWTDAPAVEMTGLPYYYHVEGYYVYGFKVPVWVDAATGLPLGSLTTDRTSPERNVLPASAFIDGGKKFTPGGAPGDQAGVISALKPKPLPASPKAVVTLGPNLLAGA